MPEPAALSELPLFLLNAVLFPGATLPLRVFEPRYRQMVDFCMERDRTFGVLLIRSGQGVGGPAEPYTVGTMARIEQVEHQADGTSLLLTVGVQRFQLLGMIDWQPFSLGAVEYLTEYEEPAVEGELVVSVEQRALRCIQLLLALNGEWVRRWQFPVDGPALSYLVAARLPLNLPTKQQLLEAPNAKRRLELELPLLEELQETLWQRLMETMWLRSANLN